MKIINASYEILTEFDGKELERIEGAARTCYKSKADNNSKIETETFIENLIRNGHYAMLEHSILSVKFICDRGVSHELVRHRLASFAQESTRYCNYGKDGEITFIKPCFFDEESDDYKVWLKAMKYAEIMYLDLIKRGRTPQEARSVLPNSVKTEVVMTANYREWRHFFELRALGSTGAPHPQMRELALPLLKEVNTKIPVVFDGIWMGCC